MTKYEQFKTHYTEHMPKVYRYVFFRVNKDKDTAEDLVSEIFLKALEKFETFDSEGSFTAWIFGIAKNHLIDHYRRNKQNVSLDEIENIVPDKSNIKTETDEIIDSEHLQRAMETLSEDKKELIRLRYFSEYSFKEIAEIVGKDEIALRVSIHRTLKELKEKLSHPQ